MKMKKNKMPVLEAACRLQGGQLGAELRPKPQKDDSRSAGKKQFLLIDSWDGVAEDVVLREVCDGVANNFGVDVTQNSPIL